MRIGFMLAATAILAGCQTVGLTDQASYAYSGSGEARYESEMLSARAQVESGQFQAGCGPGDKIRYRLGGAETLVGDCTRFSYPPTLVRQKVLSNEEAILMVMNSGLGVAGEGTLILANGDRLFPIEIANLESFGDVLARNRIVINGGTIDGSPCGMTMWKKELTLDWERGRIASERTLPVTQRAC